MVFSSLISYSPFLLKKKVSFVLNLRDLEERICHDTKQAVLLSLLP